MTDTTVFQNIDLSSWTTLYASSGLITHRNVGKLVQLMILSTIIAINGDNQLKERNMLSKWNAHSFKDKLGGTIIITLHERIKQ